MQTQLQKRETTQPTTEAQRRRVFSPLVDIFETEESFVLTADMPGVTDNSVELTLEDDLLTIEGHVEHSGPEGYELDYREYVAGDYRREFRLGRAVDREKVSARVTDGVLTVTLPKAKSAQPRKIAISH